MNQLAVVENNLIIREEELEDSKYRFKKVNFKKFQSETKQDITEVDKEYENHIQDKIENLNHPRKQSIKNLQKAKKLHEKLQDNSQLLDKYLSKDLSPFCDDTSKNDLQNEALEEIKQQMLNNQKSEFLSDMKAIREKIGFQFIIAIKRQEEYKQQIEQLELLKLNLKEYQLESKIAMNELYTIHQYNAAYCKESNCKINFNSEVISKLIDIEKQYNLFIQEHQQEKYQKKRENLIESLQIQIDLIVYVSIDNQISADRNYIQLAEDTQREFLSINSKAIFQLYSLTQYSERFLSTRFTKCIYLYTQILMATLINIIFSLDLSASVQIHTIIGSSEIYFFRIAVTAIFSYMIPYFFFGSVTNIFAKATRQIQHQKQLSFDVINKMRNKFLITFILVAGFQILICFFGLIYFHLYTDLSDPLTETYLVVETLLSQIINWIIFDGVIYYIYNVVSSIHKDQHSAINELLMKFLACRGFYYYIGYDNFYIYKQQHLANLIQGL